MHDQSSIGRARVAALIFGADEWLVRKAMRELPPPKAKVVDLSRVPDDPPPPPPAPPLDKDVFP